MPAGPPPNTTTSNEPNTGISRAGSLILCGTAAALRDGSRGAGALAKLFDERCCFMKFSTTVSADGKEVTEAVAVILGAEHYFANGIYEMSLIGKLNNGSEGAHCFR